MSVFFGALWQTESVGETEAATADNSGEQKTDTFWEPVAKVTLEEAKGLAFQVWAACKHVLVKQGNLPSLLIN